MAIKETVNDEVPTEYKEKKWGKEEGGEYIIEGFSFRGKHAFGKAVEGLKKDMKKGAQNQIDGVKF